MELYNWFWAFFLFMPATGALAFGLILVFYDKVIKRVINKKFVTSLWFQIFLYYLLGAIIWIMTGFWEKVFQI